MRTLSPGTRFRIRPWGSEHLAGDIECAACGTLDGVRYPHPHREEVLLHLEYLVHGEWFNGLFLRICEGGCVVPPLGPEDQQDW